MLTISHVLESAPRAHGLAGRSFLGRFIEGLCAAQLFKNQLWRHLQCRLQGISSVCPFPGPVLTPRHASQLMGSNALISCHTKDNSKYSLSAATAASVLVSIYHAHCALCFESALAVHNAFVRADNITKLLVNV